MSNSTFSMSREGIAKIVGPEAAMLVSEVDHHEMDFGKHWIWSGEQLFTLAGLELLIERMGVNHKVDALALKGEVAARLAKLAPVASAATAEPTRELAFAGPRKKAIHDPLNGYVPDNDL